MDTLSLEILQSARASPLDLPIRNERQIIQTIAKTAMPWHLFSGDPITRALALPQSPTDVRRVVATDLALRYGVYPDRVELVAANKRVLVVGFTAQGSPRMANRDPLLPLFPWGGLGDREHDMLDSGIICILQDRYEDARSHFQTLALNVRNPLARWALAMNVAWCAMHL